MNYNKNQTTSQKKILSFFKTEPATKLTSDNRKNRQRGALSVFLNSKGYSLPIRLFVGFLGMSFLLLGLMFKKLPPLVPFYYSLPWGDEQLVAPYELFIIPVSLIVIFIANIEVSLLLIKKDTFLIQLLLWSTCCLALAGFITLLKIVLLVS